MRITRWLWGLWIAMILSMMLRRQTDTYMIVALIIIPILIVLIDLHEEIATLKDDNKHQRKFVMDRYNVLLEKMKDVSSQIEKRLVVDFAEFAKNNPPSSTDNVTMPIGQRQDGQRLKKRKRSESPAIPIDFSQPPPETPSETKPKKSDDDFEDI